LAALAGILITDVADNPDLGGNYVELLANFLADSGKSGAAATDLLLILEIVDHFYSGKVFGKGLSFGLLPSVLGNDYSFGLRFFFPDQLFGFIKETQLLRVIRLWALLRFPSEDLSLKKSQPLFQEFNLGFIALFLLLDGSIPLNNDCLQGLGVVG
jgi:hypothetical protein